MKTKSKGGKSKDSKKLRISKAENEAYEKRYFCIKKQCEKLEQVTN